MVSQQVALSETMIGRERLDIGYDSKYTVHTDRSGR